MPKLKTIDYLRHYINGTLPNGAETYFIYPTATSKLLGYRISNVIEGEAWLTMDVDPLLHGNQQGTIHGGMLSELADAAMGTAQSTLLNEGESFASIDLSIKFFRPVWKTTLTAHAKPVKAGKNINHYSCEIINSESEEVAIATGTFMVLKGDDAKGR